MGDRDLDPLAAHPAEAVGELPEEHRQPGLDAPLADDREQHRQVAGAHQAAADQRHAELGKAGAAVGEVAVEDGEPPALDHQPVGADWKARPGFDLVPGSQQVARAEQLGAIALPLHDAAAEEAGEDEEPVAVLGHGRHRLGVPLPLPHLDDLGATGAPRRLQPLGRDAVGEIGIAIEYADNRHGRSLAGAFCVLDGSAAYAL
jgi:hypothetical protein